MIEVGCRPARATTSSATRLTSSEDWVETSSSRGSARLSALTVNEA